MIKLIEKNNGALNLAQKLQKGETGGYYIPSVDEQGTLTWQPSEPDLPSVGASNIKGVRGDSGVYVGEDEPTDANVWINPDGTPTEGLATTAYVDEKIAEIELMPGEPGKDGEDYVLTEQDKTDIAELVLDMLPAAEGVSV